ncbi:MAG: acetylglutamate kinase [Spirochaetia bacterium]|jgi:acetylglutamate kinase|nr:acetylglutamate kinase [Spirochaetia bacterium]
MEKYIEKASVLIEALPYIKEFNEKIVVIKYGGSAMTDNLIRAKIIEDIALMKYVGMKPVIVHGGGPAINNMLDRIGKKTKFINGMRVTDQETMETVEMVLSGNVNKNIVNLLAAHNIKAIGISGKDGKLFTAEKLIIDDGDLGHVGILTEIDTSLLNVLLTNGYTPVIAPISSDKAGNTYNINADMAASRVASALKAQKLIYISDIPGILRDIKDEGSLIHQTTLTEIEKLKKNGIINDGMIPKVDFAVQAVTGGVSSVHILDGRVEHSILLEIFTKKGIGTIIQKEQL